VTSDLYIVRCSDGSYRSGTTRGSLDLRIAQHNPGEFDGFTSVRRPVELVFHQEFSDVRDAIAAERQVKGWRRVKKEVLISGDFDLLPNLAKRISHAR